MANDAPLFYAGENLVSLHREVEQLEDTVLIAIEDFEKKLQSLEEMPAIEDTDWSPRLDTIEIYSMEKPSLAESIRQIQ